MVTSEDLQRTAELIKRAEKTLLSIPENALRDLSIAQNLVGSLPTDYFKKITEQQKALADSFARIQIPDISYAIRQLTNPFIQISVNVTAAFKRADELSREASQILFALGWWIYPDWTFTSLREIIQSHNEGKDNEIEEAILAYFHETKLDQMVQDWKTNSKLSPRIHILQDAVWAHNQGRYTLSIPALLPNVEGMINEHSGETGYISQAKCLKILNDYVNKKYDLGPLSSFYPLAVLKFVEGLLQEKFEWGKPSAKGRHPILHGHHVTYNDKVFSLKLLLLIDYIQNLI